MKICLLHTMLIKKFQENELELRSIIEPDPIAFTFDTLGWKIILALFILLSLFLAYKLLIKYKKNQYRRDAVKEIEAIITNNQYTENLRITKLLFILKRTALQTYNRTDVASLQGDTWLEFLDNKVTGVNFTKYKQTISDALYREFFDTNVDFNKTDFFQMTLKWIKHHA